MKYIWQYLRLLSSSEACFKEAVLLSIHKIKHDERITIITSDTGVDADKSYVALVSIDQCYSTFFVRVPPDIISLQFCTPRVVGV
jgi:hypothetical protein